MTGEQTTLPLDGPRNKNEADFLAWKETPGSPHVLKLAYILAARLIVPRWRRTGIPVSATLLYEELRQQIKERRIKAKGMRIKLAKWRGYTLNNNIRPYLARHIVRHRPDWAGVFEFRGVEGQYHG